MTFKEVFPEPLEVRWLVLYADGRRKFEVLRDFYQVHADGTVDKVEKGFVSDGASIPRILWRIESPYGPLLESAVPHDQRYRSITGKRRQADDYFREGMEVVPGLADWKRPVIYQLVRLFGGRGWGR